MILISLIFHVKPYLTKEGRSEEAMNNKYPPVFNYELKKEDLPKFSIEKFEYPDSNKITKESKFKLKAKYEGNLDENDQEFYLDIIIENNNEKISKVLFCQIEGIEDKNYVNFICGIDLKEDDLITFEKIDALGFSSNILQKIQINKNKELKEEEEEQEEEDNNDDDTKPEEPEPYKYKYGGGDFGGAGAGAKF